jgi:hypothetical protein
MPLVFVMGWSLPEYCEISTWVCGLRDKSGNQAVTATEGR